MGATIIKRGNAFRVRFRYKGLKDLSLTFRRLDEALTWIHENEDKYLENPEGYHRWICKNRISLREKGVFHKFIPSKGL